jgi:hypothetical protein
VAILPTSVPSRDSGLDQPTHKPDFVHTPQHLFQIAGDRIQRTSVPEGANKATLAIAQGPVRRISVNGVICLVVYEIRDVHDVLALD